MYQSRSPFAFYQLLDNVNVHFFQKEFVTTGVFVATSWIYREC